MEKLPEVLLPDTLYGGPYRLDYWTINDFNNNINSHNFSGGRSLCGYFQLYVQSEKYKYENFCFWFNGNARKLHFNFFIIKI